MWGWRSSIPLDRIYMIRYVSLLYAYGSEKSNHAKSCRDFGKQGAGSSKLRSLECGHWQPLRITGARCRLDHRRFIPVVEDLSQPTSVSGRGDSTVQRAHGDAAKADRTGYLRGRGHGDQLVRRGRHGERRAALSQHVHVVFSHERQDRGQCDRLLRYPRVRRILEPRVSGELTLIRTLTGIASGELRTLNS